SDQVVHLIGTWMPKEEIAYSLDEIPAKGTTKLELWSSDFWPYRSGGVAYRYAHRAKFRTYQMTRKAYEQPADWFKLLEEKLPLAEVGKKILDYSPAEKYDLSVADETFQMTRDQLDRGQEIIKRSGHLPGWAGMCDGWA